MCAVPPLRPILDPFIGYDEDSMDSETSSMASFRTDRTPATPDDDLDEVKAFLLFSSFLISLHLSLKGEKKHFTFHLPYENTYSPNSDQF